MSVSFAASCRDPFVASLDCFCISSCPIFFDVEDSPEFEILPFRFPRSDSFCNSSYECLFFSMQKSAWKCSIYEGLAKVFSLNAWTLSPVVEQGLICRVQLKISLCLGWEGPWTIPQRILGVPSGRKVDPSLVAVHSPAMSTSFVMTFFSSSSNTGVALLNLIYNSINQTLLINFPSKDKASL